MNMNADSSSLVAFPAVHSAAYPYALAALEDVAPEAPDHVDAALSFALARLAGASDRRPIILAISRSMPAERGVPYMPGLLRYGLDRERLLLVAGRDADLLWAAEEALRSEAFGAALMIVGQTPFVASKRLDHAAKRSRAVALLVHLSDGGCRLSAARRRWRIAPRLSPPDADDARSPGAPAWNVSLVRRRDGSPGRWTMEWDDDAHRLRVAEQLGAGRLDAQPRQAA